MNSPFVQFRFGLSGPRLQIPNVSRLTTLAAFERLLQLLFLVKSIITISWRGVADLIYLIRPKMPIGENATSIACSGRCFGLRKAPAATRAAKPSVLLSKSWLHVTRMTTRVHAGFLDADLSKLLQQY